MDLPPDKVKLLRQYDDEKKWDMICDQVYLMKIENLYCSVSIDSTLLKMRNNRNEFMPKKRHPTIYASWKRIWTLKPLAVRRRGEWSVVQHRLKSYAIWRFPYVPITSSRFFGKEECWLIRSLILLLSLSLSLRWVREFLNEENQGLDVLIDYLSFRLLMMKYELKVREDNNWEETIKKKLSNGNSVSSSSSPTQADKSVHDKMERTELSSPRLKRASKHVAKLKVEMNWKNFKICSLVSLFIRYLVTRRWANRKMIFTSASCV